MRIGQASIVVFLAKFLGSILGFVATVIFARIVGAEILGIYALLLTITSWASFASNLGVGSATTKRISEDQDPGSYLTAGAIWAIGVGLVISGGILIVRSSIESYIPEFGKFISISPAIFIIILLFVTLLYEYPIRALVGERNVHIAALLKTTKQGTQSLFQIILVAIGYSLLGMIVGYAIGGILIGFIAIYIVTISPKRPTLQHFISILDYAKYSWVGKLKSRIFNDIDILLLGVFTSPASVGVYSVVWSLSKFIDLFSDSISSTLFPEISYDSTQGSTDTIGKYVERSLAYAGLIAIPGFVGGSLLAEELLLIYGKDFTQGSAIISMLIFGILVFSYQKQFVNALNGIDRPDLSFRVNIVFAVFNTVLNLLLIPQYGIRGAAIASVISVMIALFLSYYYLHSIIQINIPANEIIRQMIAALLMGVFVVFFREILRSIGIYQQNIISVILLVSVGANLYFTTLFIISVEFRRTVEHNIPKRITEWFD